MDPPDALELDERAPQAEPEQPEPASVQVTPLFCESFCTVALTVCVFPTCTLAEVGFTLTATGAGGGAVVVTVIADAAILVVSAIALALSVTAAGDGVLAGAV
jgi:hypothetical protein